jgi:hypothetical protein
VCFAAHTIGPSTLGDGRSIVGIDDAINSITFGEERNGMLCRSTVVFLAPAKLLNCQHPSIERVTEHNITVHDVSIDSGPSASVGDGSAIDTRIHCITQTADLIGTTNSKATLPSTSRLRANNVAVWLRRRWPIACGKEQSPPNRSKRKLTAQRRLQGWCR